MTKIKMVLTAECEYKPDPTNFPKGSTIEDMAKIDCEKIERDPGLFIEVANSIKASYEIIEE